MSRRGANGEEGAKQPDRFALFRLEHRGVITSEWGESENNLKAKSYKLTRTGRERLAGETERWNQMAGIMGSVLRTTPEGA